MNSIDNDCYYILFGKTRDGISINQPFRSCSDNETHDMTTKSARDEHTGNDRTESNKSKTITLSNSCWNFKPMAEEIVEPSYEALESYISIT